MAGLALAKMGAHNITVYDPDNVDWVNLPNQMYGPRHVGTNKAEALADVIKFMEDIDINHLPERYEEQPIDGGVVVFAVDSIDIRKNLFRNIRRVGKEAVLVIDGRMGAEYGELHTWAPGDMESMRRYNGTLWSEEEVVNAPCTAKATTYCTLSLASAICAMVRNLLTEREIPAKVYIDNTNHIMDTL